MSAVANFTTRHGLCSILGKNTAFCPYSVQVKYWCTANSNFAYFIKLMTALECQKQLLMSSISNLGGRESLETAVIPYLVGRNLQTVCFFKRFSIPNQPVKVQKISENSRFEGYYIQDQNLTVFLF